jgi:hypothetical protein
MGGIIQMIIDNAKYKSLLKKYPSERLFKTVMSGGVVVVRNIDTGALAYVQKYEYGMESSWYIPETVDDEIAKELEAKKVLSEAIPAEIEKVPEIFKAIFPNEEEIKKVLGKRIYPFIYISSIDQNLYISKEFSAFVVYMNGFATTSLVSEIVRTFTLCDSTVSINPESFLRLFYDNISESLYSILQQSGNAIQDQSAAEIAHDIKNGPVAEPIPDGTDSSPIDDMPGCQCDHHSDKSHPVADNLAEYIPPVEEARTAPSTPEEAPAAKDALSKNSKRRKTKTDSLYGVTNK